MWGSSPSFHGDSQRPNSQVQQERLVNGIFEGGFLIKCVLALRWQGGYHYRYAGSVFDAGRAKSMISGLLKRIFGRYHGLNLHHLSAFEPFKFIGG